MTDTARVEKFLDDLSKRPIDTFTAADEVRLAQKLLPDVDWAVELRLAFRREEKKDPEANRMRGLAQHMASELLGYNK